MHQYYKREDAIYCEPDPRRGETKRRFHEGFCHRKFAGAESCVQDQRVTGFIFSFVVCLRLYR